VRGVGGERVVIEERMGMESVMKERRESIKEWKKELE
jgi:hypothetical protein